jgi:hypothetical protein
MTRIVLGALCLAYVPFLGWISLVTTPTYVTWPMLSALVPPVVFASLALGDAMAGALEQSVPRAPYGLAVLLPLCVAGAYLYVSRRK